MFLYGGSQNRSECAQKKRPKMGFRPLQTRNEPVSLPAVSESAGSNGNCRTCRRTCFLACPSACPPGGHAETCTTGAQLCPAAAPFRQPFQHVCLRPVSTP